MTLELWSDPEGDGELSCCSAQAVRGARALAHELGLPHFSIDLREEFRAGVVDGWLQAHRDGLTPNPCVACNGHVRLDAMLELASGSARRHSPPATTPASARRACCETATDERKDQSYVLSALSAASLARMRFPLGALSKPEVRELAERAGLSVARRPRLPGPVLPRRHRPGALSALATPTSGAARGRSPTSGASGSASIPAATC